MNIEKAIKKALQPFVIKKDIKPDFKLTYCDGCYQQTKYVRQNFVVRGKRIDYYVCERCGRTG